MEKYYAIKIFNNIGIDKVKLIDENKLPCIEDAGFDYTIDVVPYRLNIEDENFHIETIANEIPRTSFNDLEDYYLRNINDLEKKWTSIIYKLAYFYNLEEVILYYSPKDEEIRKQTKRDDLYMALSPLDVMGDIEEFKKFIQANFYSGSMIFKFSNDIYFYILEFEIFAGLVINKDNDNSKFLETLDFIAKSEGLFLRQIF